MIKQTGQVSPDGNWRWDGGQWCPTSRRSAEHPWACCGLVLTSRLVSGDARDDFHRHQHRGASSACHRRRAPSRQAVTGLSRGPDAGACGGPPGACDVDRLPREPHSGDRVLLPMWVHRVVRNMPASAPSIRDGRRPGGRQVLHPVRKSGSPHVGHTGSLEGVPIRSSRWIDVAKGEGSVPRFSSSAGGRSG